MFFRRKTPHLNTFQEWIDALKPYSITTQSEGSGRVRVSRNGIGAIVKDIVGGRPEVEKAGWIMGSEVGELVNGGYQQFWLTPAKKRAPALASQLKELHAFEEDLKEGLGLLSLYNTSLGTVSAAHMYDRVERRDSEHKPKPWEVRLAK